MILKGGAENLITTDGPVTDDQPATPPAGTSCPRCHQLVPPATDHDRTHDPFGPHPAGWRLCWCGHAWTPND